MTHRPASISRQHGVTTLAISLIMLFLMSLMIFNTSSGMLLELKTGNNQYYQAKALEAARGGVEYGISWLNTSGNYSSLSWGSDNSGPSGNNQQTTNLSSSVASQTIGGYAVAVTLWRNSATPKIIEIRAISSGDASVTVREKVYVNTISFNNASAPPLIINGCLSGVTGNPDMHPTNAGDTVIVASQASSCLDNGHLGLNGGVMQGDAFTSSAWDYAFATSKAEMKTLAAVSSSDAIHYYDASNPFSDVNWHDDLGSATSPGILIFDTGAGCPKINGNVTIYGIVYYAAECGSDQGWGNTTIYGSVISEGNITQLTANTDFYPWQNATIASSYSVVDLAKLPASWRDF